MNNLIKTALNKYENNLFLESDSLSFTYKDVKDFCERIDELSIDNQIIYSFFDRSIESALSLVSILYTDNIFCPLSLQWSEEKIVEILTSLGGVWIFMSSKEKTVIENIIKKHGFDMNVAEVNGTEINIKLVANRAKRDFPQNAGYVYSTSGSTGKPKCVLGRKDSLKMFVEWEKKEFSIDENRVFCNVTKPTFDPYLRDIITPLISGAKIYIPDTAISLNSLALKRRITENKVTDIHLVPSMFRKLSLTDTCVKNIYLAGEVLYGNDIVAYLGKPVNVVNLYGPTETTLAKFFHRCCENDFGKDVLPVGKTIDDTNCYIDNDEIIIETNWGSLGYINHQSDDLVVVDEKRIRYFTKDRGFFDDNGDLIVLGRTNDSIKLLGEKVDLGKITKSILENEFVTECMAVGVNNGTRSYLLVAIATAQPHSRARLAVLKKLKNDGVQMVPMKFYMEEELPKNENGKIDRNKIVQIFLNKNMGEKRWN